MTSFNSLNTFRQLYLYSSFHLKKNYNLIIQNIKQKNYSKIDIIK
jgi:hypothetical protein